MFIQGFFVRQNSRSVELAVHFACIGQSPPDLFRMFREIAVYLHPSSIVSGLDILQIAGNLIMISFLEDEDISHDFGSCKAVLRQSECLDQSRFGQKLRHGSRLIHCRIRGQNDCMTIRFQSVESLCNKIVMQIPVSVQFVFRIVWCSLTERHIADHQINISWEHDFFQGLDSNIGFRIKHLCNAASDLIYFDAEELILCLIRCISDEIACSAAEFRDFPGFDSEFVLCQIPHKANQICRSVVAVQHGCRGGLVFLGCQQVFEFLIPAVLLHENFCQTAPSGEL